MADRFSEMIGALEPLFKGVESVRKQIEECRSDDPEYLRQLLAESAKRLRNHGTEDVEFVEAILRTSKRQVFLSVNGEYLLDGEIDAYPYGDQWRAIRHPFSPCSKSFGSGPSKESAIRALEAYESSQSGGRSTDV